MVRSVCYSPVKAFTISAEEKKKAQEISATVAKKAAGKLNGKAAAAQVEKLMADIAKLEVEEWAPKPAADLKGKWDDQIDTKEGILIACGVLSAGELSEDIKEFEVEEPRVIVEDDDDEGELRELW